MAGRPRVAALALLAATMLVLGACGRPRPSAGGAPVAHHPTSWAGAPAPSPTRASSTPSPGSWQGGQTGTKRSEPAKATGLWSGAGRHPQWRGCRHTYDPSLTTFIFGPTPG